MKLLLNDLRCYVYYKSLFGTGRDGRDGTNGVKVCNLSLFYYSLIPISDTKYAINHNIEMHSSFKQRQVVTMVTKCFLFFQGEKGDTGLRGLDGNAGVKVDKTVLVA